MRILTIFFIFLMFCISACNTKPVPVNYPAGGYPYLKNISSSDSDYYFLPIRKLIPRDDSMVYYRTKYFFKSFDEPNLSEKPAEEDIFRLSIEGFAANSTIITMTKDGLVVKQHKKDNKASPYPTENTELLTGIEKEHYYFLNKFYPFGKKTYKPRMEEYKDSMIKKYPKLLDSKYYQYLLNRLIDKNAAPFEYVSKKIPLTANQFKSLVDSINASGYWNLPYKPLFEAGTEGWGFCLEANTRETYNIVICSGDINTTETKKIKQACQQLLDYAQIDPGLKIWSKEQEEITFFVLKTIKIPFQSL